MISRQSWSADDETRVAPCVTGEPVESERRERRLAEESAAPDFITRHIEYGDPAVAKAIHSARIRGMSVAEPVIVTLRLAWWAKLFDWVKRGFRRSPGWKPVYANAADEGMPREELTWDKTRELWRRFTGE
jgi:hypothetical protein